MSNNIGIMAEPIIYRTIFQLNWNIKRIIPRQFWFLFQNHHHFLGERPHACKQCDRAFIKKIDLQRHELTHTGVKPHVCTVCDKDFLRPLHLNYHMMIHTAERPHRCTYCGKGFIRRYYLKDHMMKHHGIKDTKKGSGVVRPVIECY